MILNEQKHGLKWIHTRAAQTPPKNDDTVSPNATFYTLTILGDSLILIAVTEMLISIMLSRAAGHI